MTLTRHWTIPKTIINIAGGLSEISTLQASGRRMRTGKEQCICPECDWSGKVSDCDPRIDAVALCPKCGHWVEYRDPPKDNMIRRP